MGQMLFLSPNQQHQSTEDILGHYASDNKQCGRLF